MHYTNAFIRGKKAPFRGVFKYKDASGEWRQTVRTLKAQGIAEAKRELADSMGLVGTQGRRPTFHDLRHTFATFAITEGIDVKTVSSILGHANAAMTLNIYASADANAKQAAAATIDEVMERRLSPQEMGNFA